ncbi:MAG: phosphopyruvate hydratase [Weeksellaceae bacterium]
MRISSVRAIQILDSRGKPTLRTFITLEDGSIHQASVPSGASTGKHEALELRDGDALTFAGQGVTKAINYVNTVIKQILIDKDVDDLKGIDRMMIDLDGTDNKSKLGANAILSVSMAAARAAAYASNRPLWRFLHDYYFQKMTPGFPRLMVNLINGGKHANWNFDLQEFIIITTSTEPSFSTRVAAEIFTQLGQTLKKQGFATLVGDEGGYSPAFSSNEQAYEAIIDAAKAAGYENTKDYELAMDAAASEFYENGEYVLKRDNRKVSPQDLIKYYSELGQKYHIQSFEDPFEQDDWASFTQFTQMAKQFHFQVVGDDFTVTNPERLEKAIKEQAANAIIIKPNQIGTISESAQAINMAKDAGWKIAVSHRSGETEDSFIADLAYGSGADFIKTGSMSRSERLAKYNRLLEIEAGM